MKRSGSKGIWVDVFELSRFRGKRRRLYGPARFVSLRTREVNWGISIDSLIVGPEAYIRLFGSADGEGRSVWLMPRQAISDLQDARVGDEIDSLSIHDRPPRSRETGFTDYLRATRKKKPAAGPRDQTRRK